MSFQKRSGDPNPRYFSKSAAVQMGGVLPYKWAAYCSTNGRRIAGFPLLLSLEARKVRQYKWGAYCCTKLRRTVVLFRQVVGVGVSETLPILGERWWGPRIAVSGEDGVDMLGSGELCTKIKGVILSTPIDKVRSLVPCSPLQPPNLVPPRIKPPSPPPRSLLPLTEHADGH